MTKPLLAAMLGAMMLAPGAAWAIQELTPEPGWRYRVVDVEPSDMLNVREQPGTTSGVTATLDPNATDLVVTGVRIEEAGSVWWRILLNGDAGWVNARYLTPMETDDEPETGYPLVCLGTEPFWSLDVVGDEAELSTPETTAIWAAGPIRTAPHDPGAVVVRLENAGEVGHLAALRTYNFCSDGMSDNQYPFDMILIGPDDEIRTGCCERGR